MSASPDSLPEGGPPSRRRRPPSFRTFLVLWAGQVVSTLGSGLTGFALGVWIYQETGSVTQYAMIGFAASVPGLAMLPLAGALVDRWDRRRTMLLADTGAGLATLVLAILAWSGHLSTWHIALVAAAGAIFNALQRPAFIASTTLLVPKARLGQAAGLTQMGFGMSQLVAPALGGVLLVTIGLSGVILIDLGTFLVALATLGALSIPNPRKAPEPAGQAAEKPSLLREAAFGWRYLRERPGLLSMLLLFACTNFTGALVQALMTPLVLAFASAPVLGAVAFAAGVGLLLGTVVMTAWGGPRRRILGIFASLAVQAASLVAAGLRPDAVWIGAAAFVFLFTMPILNGCSQAIWQTKIPPSLQGRVFSVRRMVALSTLPLAFFLAGPLADHLLEPLMAPDGVLAPSLGPIFGTGEGRGIGVLYSLMGLLVLGLLVVSWRYPRLRLVEDELPDALEDDPVEEGGPAEEKPSIP